MHWFAQLGVDDDALALSGRIEDLIGDNDCGVCTRVCVPVCMCVCASWLTRLYEVTAFIFSRRRDDPRRIARESRLITLNA